MNAVFANRVRERHYCKPCLGCDGFCTEYYATIRASARILLTSTGIASGCPGRPLECCQGSDAPTAGVADLEGDTVGLVRIAAKRRLGAVPSLAGVVVVTFLLFDVAMQRNVKGYIYWFHTHLDYRTMFKA